VTGVRIVHGIEVDRVEAAVREAERQTTGEIRVALARWYFWGDVQRAAERAFGRLHMERTRQRNGVLVFVAARRHALAIVGDRGIHERVGDEFWRAAVAAMCASFRGGDLTGGTVQAVETIGRALAQHFPLGSGPSPNELPDTVTIGRQRGV
jgi:uncharacterized membrane protein